MTGVSHLEILSVAQAGLDLIMYKNFEFGLTFAVLLPQPPKCKC